jgi:hypothetical protein
MFQSLNVWRENGKTKDSVPKRKEMGGWRRLHNEELHKLYASQNVIMMIKSRRMRFARHVACME